MRKTLVALAATACLSAAFSFAGAPAAPQTAAAGSIKGRVRLMGKPPGNSIIRMGLDPKCNQLNSAKRPVQEIVVTSADGGLANVFVKLQGSFPATPVPSDGVTIDQKGCIYSPRVVGVRVGQMLAIHNSDALRHNVHSVSVQKNEFNVDQSNSGALNKFKMNAEEVMIRLKCDVHNWMTAYVGVVNHPYFAVTNETGSFEIAKAPAGTYTIQAWHERYGMLSQKVSVRSGATTTLDFTYTGAETPKRAAIQELKVGE